MKKKKIYKHYIGIDVSKNTMDYSILDSEGKIHLQGQFQNEKQSIAKWIKNLENAEDSLIIFENTGIYSALLGAKLSASGLDYSEVASLEIKRSQGITRGKTDKLDSLQIARYGLRNLDKITLNEEPELCYQKLQLLQAEREKMLAAIKSFSRTKECGLFYDSEATKALMKLNKKTLKHLENQLKLIDKEISILIRSDEELKSQQELLKTIPGVGEVVSVYLLLTTRGFRRFKTWRKFACYSGVAPFEHRSGSSVRGRTKVSHFADKKMKSLLHLSVLTAIKHDKELEQYYGRKKAEGKHSLVVINAIKCKLLARIFSVINRKTPFVKTMNYAA